MLLQAQHILHFADSFFLLVEWVAIFFDKEREQKAIKNISVSIAMWMTCQYLLIHGDSLLYHLVANCISSMLPEL